MAILRLIRTRIGSFTIDSLAKAPPRKILSRREQQQQDQVDRRH